MYMGIPLKDRLGKSILNSEANIKIHIKKYRFGGVILQVSRNEEIRWR